MKRGEARFRSGEAGAWGSAPDYTGCFTRLECLSLTHASGSVLTHEADHFMIEWVKVCELWHVPVTEARLPHLMCWDCLQNGAA